MGLELSVAWLLWVAGIFLVALAVFNVRAPYARMQELDRLADNARRYDSWRGGRRTAADGSRTGADVMRQVVRRQVLTWAGVAAVGGVLILLGFFAR
jgi:hypothetical protein